jgi:hypothetical protein
MHRLFGPLAFEDATKFAAAQIGTQAKGSRLCCSRMLHDSRRIHCAKRGKSPWGAADIVRSTNKFNGLKAIVRGRPIVACCTYAAAKAAA